MKLIYPEEFPEEAKNMLDKSLKLLLQGKQEGLVLPINVSIQEG